MERTTQEDEKDEKERSSDSAHQIDYQRPMISILLFHKRKIYLQNKTD